MSRLTRSLRPHLLAAFCLSLPAWATVARSDPPAALDPSTVVYPRSSPAAAAPTTAAAPDYRPGPALIGIGLAVFAVGGWLWWKYRGRPGGLMIRTPQRLAIEETKALGNRQFLLVVTHEKRRFLLGVCPGRVEMLTELSAIAHDQPAS